MQSCPPSTFPPCSALLASHIQTRFPFRRVLSIHLAEVSRSRGAAGAEEGTPEVGVDAQGNGIAVWSRFNTTNYMVEAAGYDGAGPLLRGLTLPSQGLVGQ